MVQAAQACPVHLAITEASVNDAGHKQVSRPAFAGPLEKFEAVWAQDRHGASNTTMQL